MADLDGAGDLDLFIGGRCVPDAISEAASSLVLRRRMGHGAGRRHSGRCATSASSAARSERPRWPRTARTRSRVRRGPCGCLAIGGQLRRVHRRMGARKAPGWWSGITTADLDSDGDWMSSPATGALQLLYRLLKSILSALLRDLAGRGVVDLVEASMTLPKDYAPAQIGRSGTCLRSSAPSSRRTKLSEGPRERLGFDPARPE